MINRAGEGFLKKLGDIKKVLFDDPLDYISKIAIEDKHAKEIGKHPTIKKVFNIIIMISILVSLFFILYYFIFNNDQKQLIKSLVNSTKETLILNS